MLIILAWLKAPKTHKEAKAAEEKDETIEKLRMQLKEVVSGQCHWQSEVKVERTSFRKYGSDFILISSLIKVKIHWYYIYIHLIYENQFRVCIVS